MKSRDISAIACASPGSARRIVIEASFMQTIVP